MDRSADWEAGYEVGYEEGRRSAEADWQAQLEDLLPDGIAALPGAVAEYIQFLQDEDEPRTPTDEELRLSLATFREPLFLSDEPEVRP